MFKNFKLIILVFFSLFILFACSNDKNTIDLRNYIELNIEEDNPLETAYFSLDIDKLTADVNEISKDSVTITDADYEIEIVTPDGYIIEDEVHLEIALSEKLLALDIDFINQETTFTFDNRLELLNMYAGNLFLTPDDIFLTPDDIFSSKDVFKSDLKLLTPDDIFSRDVIDSLDTVFLTPEDIFIGGQHFLTPEDIFNEVRVEELADGHKVINTSNNVFKRMLAYEAIIVNDEYVIIATLPKELLNRKVLSLDLETSEVADNKMISETTFFLEELFRAYRSSTPLDSNYEFRDLMEENQAFSMKLKYILNPLILKYPDDEYIYHVSEVVLVKNHGLETINNYEYVILQYSLAGSPAETLYTATRIDVDSFEAEDDTIFLAGYSLDDLN